MPGISDNCSRLRPGPAGGVRIAYGVKVSRVSRVKGVQMADSLLLMVMQTVTVKLLGYAGGCPCSMRIRSPAPKG